MDDLVHRGRKLIDILPPFMRKFGEMKEIMRAEENEFELAAASIGRAMDNAFVEDCGEEAIERYEEFLGISPAAGEELGVRKSRVLAYLCTNGNYNYRSLVQGLNVLLGGEENYEIVCDLKHYDIVCNVFREEHVGIVEGFFQKVLPMNMKYTVHMIMVDDHAEIHIGIIWQDDGLFEWR